MKMATLLGFSDELQKIAAGLPGPTQMKSLPDVTKSLNKIPKPAGTGTVPKLKAPTPEPEALSIKTHTPPPVTGAQL